MVTSSRSSLLKVEIEECQTFQEDSIKEVKQCFVPADMEKGRYACEKYYEQAIVWERKSISVWRESDNQAHFQRRSLKGNQNVS
jgi:hypothetical protein